jgi:hypothetical protein
MLDVPGSVRGFLAGLATIAVAGMHSAIHAQALQAGDAPVLELPVDCDLSTECSIQKYFDHDPTDARLDYACGRLSLDGDTGTDFRVPDYPAMEAGVAVVAAAPGVVRAIRDGMDDISVNEIGREAIDGREAGNAVVLVHGGGWETQYSHLMKGSVTVKEGDRVETGQMLGLIGLSGNTEFPHVEFSVRRNGEAVDPFTGPGRLQACGEPGAPLWSGPALAQMPYRATVFLSGGFATGRPNADLARKGEYGDVEFNRASPALVYWVDVSGVEAGDEELFTLQAPNGDTISRHENRMERSNISWFGFSGARPPQGGWPAGTYEARYMLSRDGAILIDERRAITLE